MSTASVLASARAGNVIGGGDWTPRQLIPDTIAAFLQSRPVALRHPQAVRPWQHVLDCLAGYLTLAEALAEDVQAYSGAWNFGPADEDSRPVRYVVETLGVSLGHDIRRGCKTTPATRRKNNYSGSMPPKPQRFCAGNAVCRSTRRCAGWRTGIATSMADETPGNSATSKSRLT